MPTDLQTAKAALRRQINAALDAMSAEQRAAGSARICVRLRELAAWKDAKSILLFAPTPTEPDIWPLLAEVLASEKIAALPRYPATGRNYIAARVQNPESEIVSGKFGIREPAARCPEISLSRFDLVLVPGVAFDRQGHRLGRGRGFYDRLLAGVKGVKCGIAIDEQVLNEVPAGAADVRLDFIVTPTRSVKIAA
jgi:5-formyltetrahydrofolate cyclo-ligase